MSYQVWDISTWAVMSQEARGLDPKDWVVPPTETTIEGQAHWWLYKPVKSASYRRFDDWSEKMSAELARLLDLPAARVELARGQSDEGIVSGNVTPNGWSMESGDTLLSEYEGYVSCSLDDRPRNRLGHNLANIGQVLADCAGPPGSSSEGRTALDVFAGYLVFDAWIANTDRHAINWGVLTCEEDGRQALAASFDHGSALASGTQDAKLVATTPEHYASRGFAGRFENGAKLPLTELALASVQMAGASAEDWLERLARVTPSEMAGIVGAIPSMSVERRTFLCTLLETNQRRLMS